MKSKVAIVAAVFLCSLMASGCRRAPMARPAVRMAPMVKPRMVYVPPSGGMAWGGGPNAWGNPAGMGMSPQAQYQRQLLDQQSQRQEEETQRLLQKMQADQQRHYEKLLQQLK
jgi:hypothetical protein